MRDNTWLFQKLDEMWDKYFSDVPQDNNVEIRFGRKARQRLGSIKQGQKKLLDFSKGHPKTTITINGLFRDEKVPEYVVTSTIAHEMCHYAHGFSSPIKQKHDYPHYQGVVTREMNKRGFGGIQKKQKKWLKEEWEGYIKENLPQRGRRRRKRRVIIKWI